MNTNDLNSLPLVSVVMGAYNHAKFVARSIQSILLQTYPNIELIILDDGSQDGTGQEIEKLASECKERFARYLFIKKTNGGIAQTMNQGIGLAEGGYIIGASSDDVFLPNAFAELVRALLSLGDDCAVVCGNADFIDADDQKLYLDNYGQSAHEPSLQNSLDTFVSYFSNSLSDFSVAEDFGSYSSLLRQNYIPSLCTIIRKKVLLEVGLYTAGISIEDFDLWLKISKKYKIRLIEKVLIHYRLHGANASLSARDDISADTLKLLLRERGYCRRSPQLMGIWDQRFFGILYSLIKKGKIKALARIGDLRVIFFFAVICFKKMLFQEQTPRSDPS